VSIDQPIWEFSVQGICGVVWRSLPKLQSFEVPKMRGTGVTWLDDVTWGDMDTLDARHVSLCFMFSKYRLCQLLYDTCHPSHRATCPCLIFFHMAVDLIFRRLGTLKDSRHKQFGLRTLEGPKSGVHLIH